MTMLDIYFLIGHFRFRIYHSHLIFYFINWIWPPQRCDQDFCDFMQEMISMMNNVKGEVRWILMLFPVHYDQSVQQFYP